jgi:GNAT superfamily N-acetyltransferase
MTTPPIEYLPDSAVTPDLDRQLRELLAISYAGTGIMQCFATQRYWHELPDHHWFLRAPDPRPETLDPRPASPPLAAHIAIHDKTIGSAIGDLRVGGVANVAVHPDHRGRGYVRLILQEVHAFLTARNIPFAILFASDLGVYRSSGYVQVLNPLRTCTPRTGAWTVEPSDCFMVKQLGAIPWPEGVIDLRGPAF